MAATVIKRQRTVQNHARDSPFISSDYCAAATVPVWRGQDVVGVAADVNCASAADFTDATLSAKKDESRVAIVTVFCPSNHWRCLPGCRMKQ